MKINELLDSVKAAQGLNSDGELARKLDVDKRRVSDYRKGIRIPDEFACLRIAEALGKPLDSVIATVKAATEKDETRREVWENYMKRLGGIAASFAAGLLVVVTLIVTPSPAEAAPMLNHASYMLCIMLSVAIGSQFKPVLRRIAQKGTFSVNIARVTQIAT